MTDFKNREGLSKVRAYGSHFVNSQDKCAYLLITMTELKRPRVEDYDMTTQHEQFFADYEAYQQAEKIEKFEIALKEDYGIDEETWNNTPTKIKKLMADMHEKAENHAWLMEELECWRDNMPI